MRKKIIQNALVFHRQSNIVKKYLATKMIILSFRSFIDKYIRNCLKVLGVNLKKK